MTRQEPTTESCSPKALQNQSDRGEPPWWNRDPFLREPAVQHSCPSLVVGEDIFYIRNCPECATVSGGGRVTRPPLHHIPDSGNRHYGVAVDHPTKQVCAFFSRLSHQVANDLPYSRPNASENCRYPGASGCSLLCCAREPFVRSRSVHKQS